jgi:hypothetical protein
VGSGEDWWLVVGGWWLVGSGSRVYGAGRWWVVVVASGQGRRIPSNNMQPALTLQT